MGEEIIGKVIAIAKDGKQLEIENAKINCITENTDNDCYGIVCKNSYELEIVVKNITRKRFIKQLMARGMQKNEAVEFAKYIYRKYKCYNSMYLLGI